MTAALPAFKSDVEVERIGLRLIDRTLPRAEWTHAAHLASAAWMVAARPDLDPSRDMPDIIRAYNEATGVPNSDTSGYHDTITQASLRAVRSYLAGLPPGTGLQLACNGLLVSSYSDKRWLLQHWTEAVLFSPAARRAWVEPDIAPLPFQDGNG